MTPNSLAVDLDAADPEVRAEAEHLADRLDESTPVEAAVRTMLRDVANGSRVVVFNAKEEVTPSKAAEMLGVTRQYVDRLCGDGVLAFRRLPGSRHRRILVQDVLDVAAERQRRREGGDAIRAAIAD